MSPSAPANDVMVKANAVVKDLAIEIQETDDPIRLEELLTINDQLLVLVKRIPARLKENMRLQGLGLYKPGSDPQEGFPHINGRLNGYTNSTELPRESSALEGDDDIDIPSPTTPKVDKGKQKAEPEQPEMVLSPKTFMMAEPESTDPSYREEREAAVSPMDRYVSGTSNFFFRIVT